MRKFIFICLMIGAGLHVTAQDTRSAQTLDLIINDTHNSPESRVLACVRQGEYYINKPGRGPKDLDSAAFSLKHGEQLSKDFNLNNTKGELLFLQALITKQKGLRDEGNRLNNLAVTLLRKKPGNDFLGRALLEKGDYLNTDIDKQYFEKIAVQKEAITCFDSPNYVKTRAGVWKTLGDLYLLRRDFAGNMPLALEAFQRSMDTYFSFGYKNVQDIYIEMAAIYRDLGYNQQGLNYSLLAVQTAERAGDTSFTMCQIYNHTGMQYSLQLDLVNAKKYLLRALKLAEKFEDVTASYSIANNLYVVYRRGKEFDKIYPLVTQVYSRFPETDLQNQFWSNTLYLDYYGDVKDVANGKKYCLALIKSLRKYGPATFPNNGEDAYAAISDYYGMSHEFKNAYKYWELEYAAMKKYRDSQPGETSCVLAHFRLDTASHNLASAVSYMLRYTRLRDSNFSVNRAQQEANLTILYDTKEKDFELADSRKQVKILTQNEQLQRANLQQAVLIRNITIGFTALVIIVSALLYRMVVLRKKAIRKIAKTNSLLEKLVSEKEWLLREIHHRVKNNLHTVICLLESQAAYLEKDALKAIEDSRHRIYAMSLIHQKLYENEDVKTIDMNDFVTALVHYLQDSYDLKRNITFHLEIAPILIDTSIAIPIGLIINEAITNSIKYAFVENEAGQITIKLYEEREKIVVLMADSGVGIAMELVHNHNQSMGLRLMKGLCADIGGKIVFDNKQGTEIKLVCNRVFVDTEGIDIEELLSNIPGNVDTPILTSGANISKLA